MEFLLWRKSHCQTIFNLSFPYTKKIKPLKLQSEHIENNDLYLRQGLPVYAKLLYDTTVCHTHSYISNEVNNPLKTFQFSCNFQKNQCSIELHLHWTSSNTPSPLCMLWKGTRVLPLLPVPFTGTQHGERQDQPQMQRLDEKSNSDKMTSVPDFCTKGSWEIYSKWHFSSPESHKVYHQGSSGTGLECRKTDCPGRWWRHCPWRCSRNISMCY